jgi:hypothetical protein
LWLRSLGGRFRETISKIVAEAPSRRGFRRQHHVGHTLHGRFTFADGRQNNWPVCDGTAHRERPVAQNFRPNTFVERHQRFSGRTGDGAVLQKLECINRRQEYVVRVENLTVQQATCDTGNDDVNVLLLIRRLIYRAENTFHLLGQSRNECHFIAQVRNDYGPASRSARQNERQCCVLSGLEDLGTAPFAVADGC